MYQPFFDQIQHMPLEYDEQKKYNDSLGSIQNLRKPEENVIGWYKSNWFHNQTNAHGYK